MGAQEGIGLHNLDWKKLCDISSMKCFLPLFSVAFTTLRLDWGSSGRWFESSRTDHFRQQCRGVRDKFSNPIFYFAPYIPAHFCCNMSPALLPSRVSPPAQRGSFSPR
jgi:hypothetical protein